MDSCVVDETIEVPVLVRDARGCALDARGVRYVDLDRHDRSACAAESSHCFLSSRRVATPQIDGQALPRELARDLSTQALVSAGHQRDVSFDVHFVFSVRLNKRTASCIWATNSIRERVRYFHPRAHAWRVCPSSKGLTLAIPMSPSTSFRSAVPWSVIADVMFREFATTR